MAKSLTSTQSTDVQKLQKHRFGIYRLFAKMLFSMAKCRYLGGILDLKVDFQF